MHALGAYIAQLMDGRGMSQSDLGRASGLSRQHVSGLLDPSLDRMSRMVEASTIQALARAFPDVGAGPFVVKAAESVGIEVYGLAITDPDLSKLSNEALLEILRRRLERGGTP